LKVAQNGLGNVLGDFFTNTPFHPGPAKRECMLSRKKSGHPRWTWEMAKKWDNRRLTGHSKVIYGWI
jgi:hypothetical protein